VSATGEPDGVSSLPFGETEDGARWNPVGDLDGKPFGSVL
jgi:hypothetical protein